MPTEGRRLHVARLDELVAPLLAHVASITELPPERVFFCQRDEPPFNSQADSYVFLRFEDGDYDRPNLIGAGRIDTRERIVLSATIRSRVSLDEADRDTIWLTETQASVGHLQLRHKVLDALVCFTVIDGDGNHLVTEPLKPATSRPPRKEKSPNPEWGQSVLMFDVIIHLDLDQSRQ